MCPQAACLPLTCPSPPPARTQGMNPMDSMCTLYGPTELGGDGQLTEDKCSGTTVLTQCSTEQKYVRNSMMRSLLYNQVRAGGAGGRGTGPFPQESPPFFYLSTLDSRLSVRQVTVATPGST